MPYRLPKFTFLFQDLRVTFLIFDGGGMYIKKKVVYRRAGFVEAKTMKLMHKTGHAPTPNYPKSSDI